MNPEPQPPGLGRSASIFIAGILAGALVATAGFALVLGGNQEGARLGGGQTTVLKLAHGLDTAHPVHAAMSYMADRLADKSGGMVRLEIYPNGQLGSETECIEQLQRGALAMTKTSAAVGRLHT